jgi:hypothetical protein
LKNDEENGSAAVFGGFSRSVGDTTGAECEEVISLFKT